MNKKTLFLIIALIVVLAGLGFMAFRGGEETEIPSASMPEGQAPALTETVVSGDGVVKLEIARSALPEGLAVSDITIEPVAREDLALPEDLIGELDGQVAFAYRILPEGSVFDVPVRLIFDFGETTDLLPVMLHISDIGDGPLAELADNTEFDVSYEDNRTTVTAEVSHFSTFVFLKIYFLTFDLKVPPEAPVGQVVPATAAISGYVDYGPGGRPMSGLFPESVEIKGRLTAGGKISPAGPVVNPSRETLAHKSTVINLAADDFTCQDEGKGFIRWRFDLTGTKNYFPVNDIRDGKVYESVHEALDAGVPLEQIWRHGTQRKKVTITNSYYFPVACVKGGMIMINPPSLYLDAGVAD